MLSFATKQQYFEWIAQYSTMRSKYNSSSENNLKDIQDHYAISLLEGKSGLKVLEIGGGDCRVLRDFGDTHECWNAEKFGGAAVGPKVEYKYSGVRNVHTFLGEFSSEIPENYFDLVFSISVVEHVPNESYRDFTLDISRVLKRAGTVAHAIDVYLFDSDEPNDALPRYSSNRIALYRSTPLISGGALRFKAPPEAEIEPHFKCKYASNSDREMLRWNQYAPALSEMRSYAQSVTLLAELTKT